jgi:hypothetical protein
MTGVTYTVPSVVPSSPLFRTGYQRSYGVAKLARVPIHPAFWVYWLVLLMPFVPIAFVTPYGTSYVSLMLFFVWFLTALLLVECDVVLSSWPPLYWLGEKLRPLIEPLRLLWQDRLRPRLLRLCKRCLGPWLLVLVGVPLLGMAERHGLVTGLPEVFGGVGLTASGIRLLWYAAVALIIPWSLLLTIRWSGTELDIPEMTPRDRISGLATCIPRQCVAMIRAIHFVVLPLLAISSGLGWLT